MDSVFSQEPYKSNPYYKARLKDYLTYKPIEKELENKVNLHIEIAFVEVQPKEHIYRIEFKKK